MITSSYISARIPVRAELIAQLKYAIEAYRKDDRCQCGAPIWIIGSAQAGLSCFGCITGEAAHSCGVPEPRLLRRYHCRAVQEDGRSIPLDQLYPDVKPERAAA